MSLKIKQLQGCCWVLLVNFSTATCFPILLGVMIFEQIFQSSKCMQESNTWWVWLFVDYYIKVFESDIFYDILLSLLNFHKLLMDPKLNHSIKTNSSNLCLTILLAIIKKIGMFYDVFVMDLIWQLFTILTMCIDYSQHASI